MNVLKIKKGFSLLELLLVLGIIAGIIIAAFLIFPKVRDANYIATETKNITAIRAGLISLYANTALPPEGSDIQTIAIKSKVIPENMIDSNNNIISAWGAPVYIGVGRSSDSNNLSFAIRYLNLTDTLCSRLVLASSSAFSEVKVSSSSKITGIPSGGGVIVKSIDVDPDVTKITEQCFQSSNASQNTGSAVLFMF